MEKGKKKAQSKLTANPFHPTIDTTKGYKSDKCLITIFKYNEFKITGLLNDD